MTSAIISLAIALLTAFGRHLAVIGRVKSALWFFRHFEVKRWVFSSLAIATGVFGIWQNADNGLVHGIVAGAFFLVGFAYFFDMKRFFPEIATVERQTAEQVDLDKSIAVIGVEVDGVAVAYPMDVVMPRHIINDHIAGRPILVSFCAICQSAFVFDSRVEWVDHSFQVAGVWRRNMIVHDQLTYSLWQQATGECIYGPLKGQQMQMLSGENTVWGAWVKKHPESEFAEKCVEARWGYFSRGFLTKALKHLMPKAHMPGFSDLSGMDPHAMVFGINYNGISRAYPAKEMIEANDFEADFGGKFLILSYDPEADYLTAIEPENGKQIIVEKHWWLGWKEFHADSEIWRG